MKRALLAASLCALAACAPSGQLIVYVDTDAWLPPTPTDAPDLTRPPYLFDELRVDILRADDALDAPFATRDFAVDTGAFAELRVSLGVAPPIGDATLRARARLFRSDRLIADEPPVASTLDTTVTLPAIGSRTTQAVTVMLSVADVGQPVGADAPMPAELGAPASSMVGTWPGATIIPCTTAAADDEVCVPGGAFWIGDPALASSGDDPPDGEQLVVVSPFFIDKTEVSVGAFRAHESALPAAYFPQRRTPSTDLSTLLAWCTYTDTPQGFEALPLNCVARDAATDYCQTVGKILPTEAQFEFVATGRGREQAYPWGNDDPRCADAVWGLGDGGGSDSVEHNASDGTCRAASDLGDPRPSGTGLRDRVAIPASAAPALVDLGGNVAEWARDAWAPLGQATWAERGVLTDPFEKKGAGDEHDDVARGGSWRSSTYELRAGTREAVLHNSGSHYIGFRCSRPGN